MGRRRSRQLDTVTTHDLLEALRRVDSKALQDCIQEPTRGLWRCDGVTSVTKSWLHQHKVVLGALLDLAPNGVVNKVYLNQAVKEFDREHEGKLKLHVDREAYGIKARPCIICACQVSPAFDTAIFKG